MKGNNKIIEKKFSEVAADIKKVAPELLEYIKKLGDNVNDITVHEVQIDNGSLLFENGIINPIFMSDTYKNAVDYASFPLLLVTHGEFELFLPVKREVKIAQKHTGLSSIPLKHAYPGDLLGVFETCDAMLGSPESISKIQPWSLYCGKRTSVIINYQKKPLRDGIKKYGIPHRAVEKSFSNHANIIYQLLNSHTEKEEKATTSINSAPDDHAQKNACKVIIFPKSLIELAFNKNSDLSHYLIKAAWTQSKHIRDSQLLNIEWENLSKEVLKLEGLELKDEMLEFIKHIIMAGNGLAPVFVRTPCATLALAEELLCKITDDSLIFTAENLDSKTGRTTGYLPLRYHFSRTESSFFSEPRAGDTYVKRLEKLQSVINVLQDSAFDFGFGEKFKITVYCNSIKKDELPEKIYDNTEPQHTDIHFKKRHKENLSLFDNTQAGHRCNINDKFLYAFVKVSILT